jgi:hypothetical protein
MKDHPPEEPENEHDPRARLRIILNLIKERLRPEQYRVVLKEFLDLG